MRIIFDFGCAYWLPLNSDGLNDRFVDWIYHRLMVIPRAAFVLTCGTNKPLYEKTRPTPGQNLLSVANKLNLLEFSLIYLNLLDFAFFEKRVTGPRTDGPTDGRTKPLLELHFATKNWKSINNVYQTYFSASSLCSFLHSTLVHVQIFSVASRHRCNVCSVQNTSYFWGGGFPWW